MQVKKEHSESDMEQRTGSKLGKEYVKAVYCHPAYLISMQSASCEMLGWMKHKLELFSIAGRNINNLRQADVTPAPLMAESEEELKSHLMKVKEESEKAGLKQHSKTTTMTSSPITSWQIDGKTMKTMRDFILRAPKSLQVVTAAMKLEEKL